MPLILKEGLIKKDDLIKENIFAIDNERARSQDIRSLRIAIVNLMPNKEETEINLLKLLSSQVLQIEVDLIRTATYKNKHSDSKRLEEYYKTFDEIKNDKYDGLIVTGAPLEDKPYDEIDYWDELKDIFDFARTNVYSSLFICWGAIAALDYFYEVKSSLEDKKIFGVYEYENNHQSKLLDGLDDHFSIPQSRYRRLDKDSLPLKDLQILAENDETGVSILSSYDARFVFNLGHLEYPKNTLHDEYIRDINRGLNTEKPENYYRGNEADPNDIRLRWQSTASIFFNNWLNYYIYQETPYRLDEIKPKKVAKFGGSSLASSQKFEDVKKIVTTSDTDIIVVSAPGKRHADDEKITDSLIHLYDKKEKLSILKDELASIKKEIRELDTSIRKDLESVRQRYLDILKELGEERLADEVMDSIDSIYYEDSKDIIVSRGEYLNAKILASYLGYEFVDAKEIIYLDGDKINEVKTEKAVNERIKPGKKYVVPGFYGNSNGEIGLLKRGGSDYTGSILASSLNCRSYENWTDVSGVMDKDPAKNKDAKAYKSLSYSELRKIIDDGAEVYQADALEPLIGKNIELRILNTNRPDDEGTTISD